MTISLRKATYTYGSIIERGAYTVNVPSADQVAIADYCGIASGRNVNKFEVCGLMPVRSDLVDAPYAEEFPLILECKVIHTYEIGLHTQFIGEIMDVKADERLVGEDGRPDILKVDPIIYATKAQKYHRVGDEIEDAFEIGRTVG